jgi:two-component system, sensor histidine kinase and response regulator
MNELVLIVEDEKDVVQLLRYNLQKAGYRTVVAYDGDQALSVARFGKPDLVLLDLMLPERDGWEVCRRMRANEQTAATPIIMITALDGEEFRLRGLQTGADDYIAKPFSVREVLLRVRKLLDRVAELRSHRLRRTEAETQISYLVHELKNGLSVIGGYTVLASEQDDTRDYLDRISTATQHMDQILSDASLLVRLEKGAPPPPLEPLALSEVIRDMLDSFRIAAGDKGITLHFTGMTGSRVWGERRAVCQMVTNLVSNAIKYNREGGAVWVRIDEQGNGVDLSVKDEGPGIPQDQQHRIFEKYYRCPGSERVKGSGIGLYVVKLLAGSIGGTVRVASDPVSGSTFTISFRKTGDAAPAIPASR